MTTLAGLSGTTVDILNNIQFSMTTHASVVDRTLASRIEVKYSNYYENRWRFSPVSSIWWYWKFSFAVQSQMEKIMRIDGFWMKYYVEIILEKKASEASSKFFQLLSFKTKKCVKEDYTIFYIFFSSEKRTLWRT